MALKGTISDFGIADIFQLIGQQAKTGILVLKDEVDEIRVHFQNGAVVHVDSPTRPLQTRLGSMLKDAEVITNEELEQALQKQTRSHKPLAMILRTMRAVREDEVKEIVRLQLAETLYRLFLWERGTYEFDQVDVRRSSDFEPMTAESVLMEGLRRLDEWPELRRKTPPHSATFLRVKHLPAAGQPGTGDVDVGANERRVYAAIVEDVTLESLIQYCRLGEFETCAAVVNLIEAGYIEARGVRKKRPAGGPIRSPLARIFSQAAAYLAILFLAALMFRTTIPTAGDYKLERRAIEHSLSSAQMRVIRLAVEVFYLRTGEYPQQLDTLVEAGLLRQRDLSYPYAQEYAYRVRGDRPVVLRPVF